MTVGVKVLGNLLKARHVCAAAVVVASTLLASHARASTLTFDNIATAPADDFSDPLNPIFKGSAALPAGYGGLSWNGFTVWNPTQAGLTPSGFQVGLASGANVISTESVDPTTGNQFANGDKIGMFGVSTFNLVSAVMTSAWDNPLVIDVIGKLAGATVYDYNTINGHNLSLSAIAQTNVTFNFNNVDEVDFVLVSFGSVYAGAGANHVGAYNGSGENFVLDNLVVTGLAGGTAVPLPAAVLPGLGMLGLLAGVRTLRRKN